MPTVAQCLDEKIKSLLNKLENKNIEGFELVDGLVFKKTESGKLQLHSVCLYNLTC